MAGFPPLRKLVCRLEGRKHVVCLPHVSILWLLQFSGFNLLFPVHIYVLRRLRAHQWPPKPAEGLRYFPISHFANGIFPSC